MFLSVKKGGLVLNLRRLSLIMADLLGFSVGCFFQNEPMDDHHSDTRYRLYHLGGLRKSARHIFGELNISFYVCPENNIINYDD